MKNLQSEVDGLLYLSEPRGVGDLNVTKHSMLRRMLQADFERLLAAVTQRQYVYPHESVEKALAATVDDLGVCPIAIEQALRWLGIDSQQAVGRLRRTEVLQLARTVHRYWRQRQPVAPSASAPIGERRAS